MAGAAAGGGTTAPQPTAGTGIVGSTASSQPNVFNQASQGLNAAMQGTAQGQNFYSPMYAQGYMNPYQQNVIGGLAQNAMGNYNQMANQIGTEATRAGAFGGSRHGVAQGAMAAGVQKDLNQQIGNLMYQGYNQANQQAASDQQMRLQAAAQQGNLANLGFGMGQQINQQMMQQGAMQQALQQMAMDKASGQYANWQNSPYQALNAMSQALGVSSVGAPQTTTSGYKPGLLDYLGVGASLWPR